MLIQFLVLRRAGALVDEFPDEVILLVFLLVDFGNLDHLGGQVLQEVLAEEG